MSESNSKEKEMRKVSFRARVDHKKRVQIPIRILTFKHKDKVKVTLETLEEE